MPIHTLTMHGLDCFTPAHASTSLAEFGEDGTSSFLDVGDRFSFNAATGHVYSVRYEEEGASPEFLNEGGPQVLLDDVTLLSPYAPRTSNNPTLETPGPGGLTFPAGSRIGALHQATFDGSDGESYTLAGISLDTDDKSPLHPSLETTHVVYWIGATPPDGTTLTVSGTANGGSVPVCFTSGTQIHTPHGPVAIESLRVGDQVTTLAGAARPVRWLGAWQCSGAEMARIPGAVPIRIAAGALGNGYPAAPILVSRQHRVMVSSPIARRMFGAERCLVPALAFLDVPGVAPVFRADEVRFHHVLLDRHSVVFANGLPSESLWPGPHALRALSCRNRAEIFALGGHVLAAHRAAGPAFRMPSNQHCRGLVRRHVKNGRPFLPEGLCPAAPARLARRARAACSAQA
ncbi:Hint domain-containing protein [Rhodovulum sp. YNF3179]|uniref:Hint domain-containing protein n=1 Tax=Rhodovulum sp. YNF3179 TaxID=3425127 RepID=UPI003D34541A